MINAAEDEVIPRACTEKLAAAMEMGDRVVWIQGLGHYTSMAELPRVLKATAEFFAQDLPPGVQAAGGGKTRLAVSDDRRGAALRLAGDSGHQARGRADAILLDLEVKISSEWIKRGRQDISAWSAARRASSRFSCKWLPRRRSRHIHRPERSSLDGDRRERGLRRERRIPGPATEELTEIFRSQAGGPAEDALRRARKRGTCTGRYGSADNGQGHGRRGLFRRHVRVIKISARERGEISRQCATGT